MPLDVRARLSFGFPQGNPDPSMKTKLLILALLAVAGHALALDALQFTAHLTGANALLPNASTYSADATASLQGSTLAFYVEAAFPPTGGDAFLQDQTGNAVFVLPASSAHISVPILPLSPGACSTKEASF